MSAPTPPSFPRTGRQWFVQLVITGLVAPVLTLAGVIITAHQPDDPNCQAEFKAAVSMIDQHPELRGAIPIDPDVEHECKIKDSLGRVQPMKSPLPKSNG